MAKLHKTIEELNSKTFAAPPVIEESETDHDTELEQENKVVDIEIPDKNELVRGSLDAKILIACGMREMCED